jgi:hypothetical protein
VAAEKSEGMGGGGAWALCWQLPWFCSEFSPLSETLRRSQKPEGTSGVPPWSLLALLCRWRPQMDQGVKETSH